MRSRRIRIAFPFIGSELGGSHISAVGLISGLDTEKFTPIIVLHKRGLILEKFLTARSLPFLVAPQVDILSPTERPGLLQTLPATIAFLQSTVRLVKFLRAHEVDIVHTNDGRMHATWALAARLAGAKLLWHHRGDPTARGVNTLAPLLANHIVTVSKFVRPLKPIVPVTGRLTVLHSPFDHPESLPDREACRQRFIEELRVPSDARFVGYVGSLIERKRPVRFVEAVHAFLERYPDYPLHGLIFGASPPEGPHLEEAVRKRAEGLGIVGRVHLLGFRAPIAPCMGALDALLVPAVNEPFGRTLIEAMLLETPVIATAHGGNPEAIDDGVNGYLVEPEKPEAFVPALAKLLLDGREWQRISATARDSARAKYGNRTHIEGISHLYEGLVSKGAGSYSLKAGSRPAVPR